MDLILNADKTVFMNIYLRNKRITTEANVKYDNCSCDSMKALDEHIVNIDSLNEITCDCRYIEKVNQYQYLGVVIDSGLTWKWHVDKIQKKLYSGTTALYRIRNVMSMDGKISVYKALIESVIRNGVILYGTAADCHLSKIYGQQKRCLDTLIGNKTVRYEPIDLFKGARTLTPKSFYKYSILVSYFFEHNLRIMNNKNTSMSLRKLNRLKIPQIRNNFGERLSNYVFPTLMNGLPEHIYAENNFKKFKGLLYDWLLQVL